MKFGKQIQLQAQPEWAHHYMNYKGLKKIIGKPDLSNTVVTIASMDLNGITQEEDEQVDHRATFFFRLDRELEKVNTFYLKKEAEFQVRLRSLVDKKKGILTRKDAYKQLGLWRNLLDAFFLYQQDLDKLQQFVEINGTGFRKILKKWDKRNRQTMKDQYLSRQVKVQDCFNKEVMAELADNCTTNLAEIERILEQQVDENDLKDETTKVDDIEADLFQAILSNQTNIITEILEKLKNHNELDNISNIFWRACSECIPIESINKILEYDTKINFNFIDDISYRNCLHESIINNNLELSKILIQKGTDINLLDVYGRSPLHYATIYNNLDGLKLLLENGANVEPLDHEGYSALLYSILSGNNKSVKLLLNKIGELGEDGPQALSLASEYGHYEILILLLKKVKEDNKVFKDLHGLQPLHLACRQGHVNICSLLTENGMDLNAIDGDKGWTPLFYAASEGHLDCLKVLLNNSKCKVDVYDENGLTPVYYSAYEGHYQCVELLLNSGCPNYEKTNNNNLNNNDNNENDLNNNNDNNIDEIPSLLLPPPLLPFRIYGHNYLDNKYLVQLRLGFNNKPAVLLYNNSKISSLKLIMNPKNTNNNQSYEPQSVILPLIEGQECFNFEILDIEQFGIEFILLPTFGNKVMGKGMALPYNFNFKESKNKSLPIFDTHLKVIGEINFGFDVVKPYHAANLEVNGKIQTYWKSPATDTLLGTNGNIASLVTASSLAQEYIQLNIQLTKDLIPIVYNQWYLKVSNLQLSPFTMNYDQFKQFGKLKPENINIENNKLEMREWIINSSCLSLKEVVQLLPPHLGICLDIKYPNFIKDIQLPDINLYIDTILDQVYNLGNDIKHRSFIFSSFYPPICNALNWKQPNYAVFLSTYSGMKKEEGYPIHSLKQAVHFAKKNNLLGIITEANPIIQVPLLIQHIKEAGFLLASFGQTNDTDLKQIQLQSTHGIDATISNGFLYYGNHGNVV